MLSPEKQIFELINQSNNILILTPKARENDVIAAGLAFLLLLKKLDKKFDLVIQEKDLAGKVGFLPGFNEIKDNVINLQKFIISVNLSNAKVEKIKYAVEDDALNFIITPKEGFFRPEDVKSTAGDFPYDSVIILGAPDLSSLGDIYNHNPEFFYRTPIINIDNQAANENYGQINLVDLKATSIAEIVFNLLDDFDQTLINDNMATCLLAGIIIKTNNFKSPTVSPQALEVASKLISFGARREEIVKNIYQSRSINALRLWGRVLARLSSSLNDQLIWSALNEADFSRTNAAEDDLEEVIDELIANIPQVQVIVLAYEKIKEGNIVTNFVVHSTKNINAWELIREYNPTGDTKEARVTIKKPLSEITDEMISRIQSKMGNILK